jgi:hypothetical protein
MKCLVPGFALCLFLSFNIATHAQTNQASTDDASAVRATYGASIPPEQRTEQVTVLDVAGTIASAKLVTPGWVDYMTLSKSGGEWKILSVVQRIDN